MYRQNQRGGILLVLAIIAGVILLGIAAIVGFSFWAIGEMKAQTKTALNKNAIVQEHLGEIESLSMNLSAEVNKNKDSDVIAFNAKGTKSSGVVVAKLTSAGEDDHSIAEGTLTLENGEVYDLVSAMKIDSGSLNSEKVKGAVEEVLDNAEETLEEVTEGGNE